MQSSLMMQPQGLQRAWRARGGALPAQSSRCPKRRSQAGAQRALQAERRRCAAASGDSAYGETTARRLRESAQVDDRVVVVSDMSALKKELAKAGDKLVVLELQGTDVCESGLFEEPELHWKLDEESAQRKRREACLRVKHAFQRAARECPDVVFLEMLVPDGAPGASLKEELGVQLLPSVLFFKQGELLWQQEGYNGMEQEIGEGVLYYGDVAGGGVKASQYVKELTSKQQLHDFMKQQPPDVLTVINVSTSLCTPCIKVYPAVLALAKNFDGQASFARLLGDEADDPEALMRELNIVEVPCFLFYRGGREVGRHVGSSRGDLIGQILKMQADAGIKPPPVPGVGSSRGGSRGGRAKARVASSRW